MGKLRSELGGELGNARRKRGSCGGTRKHEHRVRVARNGVVLVAARHADEAQGTGGGGGAKIDDAARDEHKRVGAVLMDVRAAVPSKEPADAEDVPRRA